MEDIICVSSGSDDDSDLEVISIYNDDKEDPVPFIREQWLSVTPVLIDITGHNFTPPRQRCSKRDTCSSLEVIDLSEDDPFEDVGVQKPFPTLPSVESRAKKVHVTLASFGKAQESKSQTCIGEDVANSMCFVGSSLQSVASKSLSQERTLTDVLQSTEDYLHQDPNCNSNLSSEQLSWDMSLEHSRSSDKIKNPFKCESEALKNSIADVSQNTKDTQLSTPAVCSIEADQKDNLDSSQKWENSVLSPYSLDSPYYCPSEVDAYIFSDSSIKSEDNDPSFTTCNSQQSLQTSEFPSAFHNASMSNALSLKEDGKTMNNGKNEELHTPVHPEPSSPSIPTSFIASPPWSPVFLSKQSKPNSPTSTEILASDTAAHSRDRSTLSSPSSSISLFISQASSPNLPERTEQKRSYSDAGSPESPPISLWDTSSDGDNENVPHNMESDLSKNNSEDRQHICLTQYRKFSQCMSGTIPHMDDDGEDEHYGPAEPLCRQSLSLVYSTIEENYPEGTLQLLSDFIQPRYYPPVDITTHLLRGIFLNPQSPDVLVIEAYNLLMKTQRYHPVDASTVPCDWELVKSVMKEQDETRRLRTEVQYMLLQYMLQVLEDDFHFKLRSQCLLHSVAKKMLSFGYETIGQVKDVIVWMMNAAKESVNHSKDVEYPKKEDNYLKIVLSLQRMLTLALEVDKNPNYSSDKLSEELFTFLNRMHSCRQIRLLLLRTLDSKLLRCKLLKLLLDEACSQKTSLPMSLNLLLHYLKSSTLASDPSDGAEKWRKWDELLQLLWMLMLSYEEVVTGHLQFPITKRFDRKHAPIWTVNDQVKCSEVQEAVGTFLSRAANNIGHALSMEMQDLLSQLQEHITDMSSVTTSH
ncbi:SUMO-interacting motif-containing protein 1-like isoform X2 [Carassius carassius]|uniref:SUMO-interacting motif-containing protein 1-like isoform X2 n=1 Tax=Carassius carassius TaxID=217509 RepID=UPI002868489F|nr:SUMO-interacting motif-containing protein 1-like isoform X2 [Carassius carassius]